MDGTGKNVKMKRKANKLEKVKDSICGAGGHNHSLRMSRCRCAESPSPCAGCRDEKKSALIPGKAFCNARRDRDLELLVLVCLDHEQDPQNERNQTNQAV
jgi:hypothetical protein